MYSLLLDTSSNKIVVSVNQKDISLMHEGLEVDKDISSALFPLIQKMLEKTQIKIQNLSFISVGTGPGSYTGVRVGASIAKAMSYALNIPLIGFCSLKAFVPNEDCLFKVIYDAKSGGFYSLKGAKNKAQVIYDSKPSLIPLKDFISAMDSQYFYLSPHMKALKEKLSLKQIDSNKLIDAAPDAHHLAKITFNKFTNKNFTLSDKLKLLYLRDVKMSH